ncbi:hypothetical protein GCM10009619_03180 [Williamsia maris]
MADDRDEMVGVETGGCVQGVREQRAPTDRVQNLGDGGFHSRTRTGGEYEDSRSDRLAGRPQIGCQRRHTTPVSTGRDVDRARSYALVELESPGSRRKVDQ